MRFIRGNFQMFCIACPTRGTVYNWDALFDAFGSILETLGAPIFDPFDNFWTIRAPLDPSREGSGKDIAFLSLRELPRDLPTWGSYSK